MLLSLLRLSYSNPSSLSMESITVSNFDYLFLFNLVCLLDLVLDCSSVQALSGPVLSAVGERYYNVTAEALRVCGELVRVLRPRIEVSGFDFKPFVHPIYNAIMTRLTNQDQDQEVKECAITCMGLVCFNVIERMR
ncbi:hypothetical protein BVRB_6g147600 [Beta vulgaris subsp. vulgaris]|nr:hypothetical protein BVRB_6g147600 [Beta vulgaris subsp. vulgaris]